MMAKWILGTLSLFNVVLYAMCCYDGCIQRYSLEMDAISKTTNDTTLLTASFCRAMTDQIQCLKSAQCPQQQRALIENMLSIFIQPDYQRTCVVPREVTNTSVSANTTSGGGVILPGTAPPAGYPDTMTSQGQTYIMCSQKVKACQRDFNQSFTVNMADYNVSGLCQSLKQYTICFVNLLSSECGRFVPSNLVYRMQQQYGGMCSIDAQANTYSMIECTNKTMKCYLEFNDTFAPAVGDVNLVFMCRALSNYTACMQSVSGAPECAPFTAQSLADIQQLKLKHNAYCGDDNGQTAAICVESFQDCFVPFNMTFFPALHLANLSLMCRSLNTYTSCVSQLSPTCSQQLGRVVQSVQKLKLQYSRKCHPNLIKIASCEPVGQCSKALISTLSSGIPSNAGLCGLIGNYFPCLERSLESCQLTQSTTEVGFAELGKLMKEFCAKVSSIPKLLQCPVFAKCTAAIWVSFSPTFKDLYEGSTWCTFMQLSIGCAEHALMSSGCFIEEDIPLKEIILDIDRQRVQTCEKVERGKDEDNLVNPGQQQKGDTIKNDDDAAMTIGSCPHILFTCLLVVLVSGIVDRDHFFR